MEYFAHSPLSSTGTLVTVEGEIVIASTAHTSLQTGDKKATPYVNGVINVTTNRIVWTDAARSKCIALPLSALPQANPATVKSSRFSSARVVLNVGAGVRVEFGSANGAKERDAFFQHVCSAVRTREWERQAALKIREQERKKKEGEYVRRRLGVAGVTDKVAAKEGETRAAIHGGFASLEQLRSQAEDLVKIADMFKTGLQREGGEEENELLNMMAEMGIDSPVTKESTGGDVTLYREQLARQMAMFLRQPVLNVGGVMTLTDAYCLVMRNRATTELVSPEDFRIACGFFEKVGVAIQVVKLQSGVLALKVDAERDQSGAIMLRKMAEERSSVTAIDVVRVRHVPIQIATAMLQEAEQLGFLVRDATTEGLRFFPNLFESFTISTVSA